MKIKYCKLNSDQRKSFPNFLGKHKLKQYKYEHKNKPAVFFGLYAPDLGKFSNHKAFGIMIWRGSDSLHKKRIKLAKSKKKIKHISISSFISKDLKEAGIDFKFIPIVGADMSAIKPKQLGDEIYTYIPNNRHEFYGGKTVEEIQKKCKYKINIINGFDTYDRKTLIKIYERCFCCLRLTEHDGLPNSVVEMGLMGRKSIYNGDTPDAIKWDSNDVDAIIRNIEKESTKIGTMQKDISDNMKNYINVKDEWLNTGFWK